MIKFPNQTGSKAKLLELKRKNKLILDRENVERVLYSVRLKFDKANNR